MNKKYIFNTQIGKLTGGASGLRGGGTGNVNTVGRPSDNVR